MNFFQRVINDAKKSNSTDISTNSITTDTLNCNQLVNNLNLEDIFSILPLNINLENFEKFNLSRYDQLLSPEKFISDMCQIMHLNVFDHTKLNYNYFKLIYGIPVIIMSKEQSDNYFINLRFRGWHCFKVGIFIQESDETDTTLLHEYIHAICYYLKCINLFPVEQDKHNNILYPSIIRLRDEIPAYILSRPGRISSLPPAYLYKSLTGRDLLAIKTLPFYNETETLIKIALSIDSGVIKINKQKLSVLCWKFCNINEIIDYANKL
jgi:hypothetical protein